MNFYHHLRNLRVVFLCVIVGAVLMLSPSVAQANGATYEYEGNDTSGTEADEPVTTGDPDSGQGEFRKDRFTAEVENGCNKCDIVSELQAYDSSFSGESSMNGGGDAEAKSKKTWVWNGPAGCGTGCDFDVDYDGDGSADSNGAATGGGPCLGETGSSSGHGDSLGDGSATGGGDTQPEAELSSVGGSCQLNSKGSLSGGASSSPTESGIEAGITQEVSGTGSYTCGGMWSISYQGEGEVGAGGSTIIIRSKAKCSTSTAATAAGCIISGVQGFTTTKAEGEMFAEAYNIVNK